MAAPAAAGEVARHYDRLDAFYRTVWGEHMHHGLWRSGRETLEAAKLALLEEVAARAEVSTGRRVLDLGCGYGGPARWLTSQRGALVTAVTNSPAQYAHAVATSGPAVEYRLADWREAGPFPALFDCAIALESAEHFEDKAELFASIRRTMRTGGRLVVAGWWRPEERDPKFLEPILRTARMPRLATGAEYAAAAEAAGFEALQREDFTHQVSSTWLRMGGAFLSQSIRHPWLWGHLLRNWRFALAALRITLAFRLGRLRYGMITLCAR